MQYKPTSFRLYQKGFTLIEMILGIVILAISFSVLTSLIFPAAEQSAKQLNQVKAAELAQSLLNEIQNKAFDDNSDMAGGLLRCGDELAPLPCSTTMQAEAGEVRSTFDDVDDYHDLKYGPEYGEGEIKDSQGNTLPMYTGFSLRITVNNDANYDGSFTGDSSTAKLIQVAITTPSGFSLDFATYRTNF